jgi:hypothetical protein
MSRHRNFYPLVVGEYLEAEAKHVAQYADWRSTPHTVARNGTTSAPIMFGTKRKPIFRVLI